VKAPSPPVLHPHIDRRKAEHEVVNRLAGPIPVVLNERHETRASTSDCLASTLLPWMWAAMCRPDGSYLHDSSIQVPPPHRHDCEELFSIPEGEVVSPCARVDLHSVGRVVDQHPGQPPHLVAQLRGRRSNTVYVPPAGQDEFFPADSATRQQRATTLAAQYRTEMPISTPS